MCDAPRGHGYDSLGADELQRRFEHHPPRGDQADRYESLRRTARQFALQIDGGCPDSREKSLALTSLEQAVMWANASIARRESYPSE